MPPFLPALARRAAGEVERMLSSLVAQGQDFLAQGQEFLAQGQEQRSEIARLKAETAAQRERADRLERRLAEQSAGLAAVGRQVDSLVTELNQRLLPSVDERIHETERDLTRLATRMLQAGQEAARLQSRLSAAEQRLGDLRERAGRLEQRTGIWRELQANVARLGEDLDALRARTAPRPRDAAEAAGALGGGPADAPDHHPDHHGRNRIPLDRSTQEDLHQ
jgi:chromosome segregation ATPase